MNRSGEGWSWVRVHFRYSRKKKGIERIGEIAGSDIVSYIRVTENSRERLLNWLRQAL